MKGIAHFCSGVAIASFFPHVVQASAEGSFVLLLAGLGGIMPDTLDFRLARYLEVPDLEIDPDPQNLDLQAMAGQIAAAAERAYTTGKPVRVQLHTSKLGAYRWRQYNVRFAGAGCQVCVEAGPVVTTSGTTCGLDEVAGRQGRAMVGAGIERIRGDEVRVNVFDGPAIEFRRQGNEIMTLFLPWHRRWSHSFVVSTLLAGLVALILGPWSGWVYWLGSVVHILEDQLGHMGSGLFYPLSRRRISGLGLYHSGDTLPNLFAVWSSAMLVLLNLDRFSAEPILVPWRYLSLGLLLPWAVILSAAWWRRRGRGSRPQSVSEASMDEIAAESEESIAQ